MRADRSQELMGHLKYHDSTEGVTEQVIRALCLDSSNLFQVVSGHIFKMEQGGLIEFKGLCLHSVNRLVRTDSCRNAIEVDYVTSRPMNNKER